MRNRPLFALVCVAAFFLRALAPLVSAETPRQWLAVLQGDSASVEEKARACQRLGEAGSVEAVSALARLLPDPVLNTYARVALERIPGSESDQALRDALGSTQGAAQIGIIQSLGSKRVLTAGDDLAPFLDHAEDAVAAAALRSLGLLATDDALPLLLAHLDHGNETRRSAAAAACFLYAEEQARRGQSAPERHIYESVLAKGPPSARVPATRGLLLADQSVALFLENLRSDDVAIRDVTLLTMRDLPSDALADALHAELTRADPALQARIVTALRDCPNEATVSVLGELLDSPATPPVRSAILDALAHLGGESAAAALLKIAEEPAAHRALVTMPGDAVERLAGDALADPTTGAEDVSARLRLIALLAERRAPLALRPLLAEAENSRAAVRTAALQALRPLVGLDEVPLLIDRYKTEAGEAKSAAFSALVSACRQSAPQEAAGQGIQEEFETATDPAERLAWARILIAIEHAPALAGIAADLEADDPDVVNATIDLLGRWPDPAPIDSLLPLCQEAAFKPRALRAILTLIAASEESDRRIGRLQTVMPFIESLAEKQAFIGIVGGTPHAGSRALLTPYRDDESVAEEVRAALKTLRASER